MGLESVTKISDLNPLWPLNTDQRRYGDDHLRNIKVAVLSLLTDVGQVAPIREVPTGTMDGSNDTFTLSKEPTFLLLILNGLVLDPDVAYTLTTDTVVMGSGYIPEAADSFKAVIW